jgi:hypothetical protein
MAFLAVELELLRHRGSLQRFVVKASRLWEVVLVFQAYVGSRHFHYIKSHFCDSIS